MSKKLWVKFQSFNPTRVSTEDCEIVDDFKEACKKKLQIINPPQELFLTTTVGGIPMEPDEGLPSTNTSKTPLIIDILPEVNSKETSESKQLTLFFRESSIFSHWFH